MTITPLGDQAVLLYLPDEAAAAATAAAVRAAAPPWLQDVVPAYASVGVFFDADRTNTAAVTAWLDTLPSARSPSSPTTDRRPPTTIPVCYELGPDLPRVGEATVLAADEVVRLPTGAEYTVYAVGFVPGFPYLGYLPKPLCGVGRLPSPRVRVEAGSVGLTGRQTGVYPLPRPGGWNLVGRTPLTIVDVADGYFPLRVGDKVRFTRIDDAEFRRLEGERL